MEHVHVVTLQAVGVPGVVLQVVQLAAVGGVDEDASGLGADPGALPLVQCHPRHIGRHRASLGPLPRSVVVAVQFCGFPYVDLPLGRHHHITASLITLGQRDTAHHSLVPEGEEAQFPFRLEGRQRIVVADAHHAVFLGRAKRVHRPGASFQPVKLVALRHPPVAVLVRDDMKVTSDRDAARSQQGLGVLGELAVLRVVEEYLPHECSYPEAPLFVAAETCDAGIGLGERALVAVGVPGF